MRKGCGKDWSFEMIKWLYESGIFANRFQLKDRSLDNKTIKWIEKLDKVFLYKQVMLNVQLLPGMKALMKSVLQNSKSTFLLKDCFTKATGLDLDDILFPHAFQINI